MIAPASMAMVLTMTANNFVLAKTKKDALSVLFIVVPGVGVEPTRTDKVRGILSPLCLPISPPGLTELEARSRVELDYTDLQSAV